MQLLNVARGCSTLLIVAHRCSCTLERVRRDAKRFVFCAVEHWLSLNAVQLTSAQFGGATWYNG